MHPLDPTYASEYHIILAFLFVALNAFFVAAEFALVKIRTTRIEVLAKKGNRLAKLTQQMVENLDPYLSATQLGITLSSLGLGWLGEPAFAKLLHPVFEHFHFSPSTIESLAFIIAFLFISALHIILGELVPKSLAIQNAERICMFVALPLQGFYIVFFPFLKILNGLANAFLKLIHLPASMGATHAHSEEELKLVVEDSFEEGNIGKRKKDLIDKALDFSHKRVSQVMIPMEKVVCMNTNLPLDTNLNLARESGHTRFPLQDSSNVIIGFVHMKDIIWSLEHGDIINLFDLRRPLIFFGLETRLDTALIEFQQKKIHVAIVENSDKKPVGLVTLEDVIEELVGEIRDEFE